MTRLTEKLAAYAAYKAQGDPTWTMRFIMFAMIILAVVPIIIGAVFCGIYFHMWTETWSYNDDYASSIGGDSDKNYYDLCEGANAYSYGDLNAGSTIGVGSISDSVG